MLTLLAQGTGEVILTGGAGIAAGGAALWLLQKLLSFKRVRAEIELGGTGGNGKRNDCPGGKCGEHDVFVKLVDDRHATLTKSVDRIETRMDTNFKAPFTKFDDLMSQLLGDKDK